MKFGNPRWREAFSLALESGLDLAFVMEGWLESRSACIQCSWRKCGIQDKPLDFQEHHPLLLRL